MKELTTELLIKLAFSLAGLMGGFFLGLRSRVPKVRMNGGGSRSNQEVTTASIGITNDPGFFGLKIDRLPVTIVSATLIHEKTKLSYAMRDGWQEPGTGKLVNRITLSPGEHSMLYVFTQATGSKAYSVYNSTVSNPVGTEPDTFEPQQYFTLVLYDSIGRRYRFRFFVLRHNHSIEISPAITWADRGRLLKDSFSMICQAFRPGRFRK